MELRLQGEDGSNFTLREGHKAVFGRGSGFNTNDRTVSRHHVLFQLSSEPEQDPRVSFEVVGKNPIWVCTNTDGEGALSLFRKFHKGHLQLGDRLCLSGKVPIWFHLSKTDNEQVADTDNSTGELNFEEMDVSGIDPVKEFGFIVMGHEFDHYPKGMIRSIKYWDWFLEEPGKDSEDEEDFGKERRKMRKPKKGKDDNEDDEWTGESEDDRKLVTKIGKGKKRGYSTRSKYSKGPNRDTKGSKNSKQKKTTGIDKTNEGYDDDDETLGGFIVDDEEDDREEENNEDEEELEEEEEDEDDDEMED